MKVKEILEQLQVVNVQKDDLLNMLENVGIEADLETEISPDVIKKLSKRYNRPLSRISRYPVADTYPRANRI